MGRISGYYINLALLSLTIAIPVNAQQEAPDTVVIPLKIRAGVEVTGPIIYLIDRSNLNTEGYISADINERYGVFAGGGYADFQYSQYNYEYLSRGFFMKAGVDINLLRPEKSLGKYWAGVGFRYGISFFSSEVPVLDYENYWGTITSSIPSSDYNGHYLEISPGFRAELFRNFTMGWSVNIKRLIHTNTGQDLTPISFPGFGQGRNSWSYGINYFLAWNIPYKKIYVIVRKEEPAESEEPETPED